jgi:hypothetical protein
VQCVADLQRWITVAIAGYADSDVDWNGISLHVHGS